MFKRLSMSFWGLVDYCNPFSKKEQNHMTTLVSSIAEDVSAIKDCHLQRVQNVRNYKKMLEKEIEDREREQALFLSVLDHLDDLVWAKDLDGKYIMANRAFREKFCYGMAWDELKGKDDIELAGIFKAKVGDSNHTFGEVCDNSDRVVIRDQEAREFLEHGNIDGKLVKLVVNKSPVYDDGVLYATCGSGRDVTWLHNALEDALGICGKCAKGAGVDVMQKLFKDIEFKEGDHAR